jgi:PadR family transcriptional regulator PadR
MTTRPRSPRMTMPTQLVLRTLLVEPEAELYGLEIGESAGLASGTVHPILARLEGLGWVSLRWEDIEPTTAGRPARRYYRLTAAGAGDARDALARTWRAPSRAVLRPLGESS